MEVCQADIRNFMVMGRLTHTGTHTDQHTHSYQYLWLLPKKNSDRKIHILKNYAKNQTSTQDPFIRATKFTGLVTRVLKQGKPGFFFLILSTDLEELLGS